MSPLASAIPASLIAGIVVRVVQILIIIISGGMFSSCVISIGDDAPGPRHERHFSPREVAERNRQRLGSLKLGMTPREAVDIMGEGSFGSGSSHLSNPHKSSAVTLADGTMLEVLYYYTEPRKEDGMVGDDELTPLFFEDGHLRGWGLVGMHAFLADRVGIDLPLPPGVRPGDAPQDMPQDAYEAWSAVPAAEAVLVD